MKKPVQVGLIFFSTLLPCYLLWLLFVGTFELHELVVGIIAAVLSSIGMGVIALGYSVPFSPTVTDVLACWRLPWYLLSDTWVVFEVSAKDLLGVDRAKSLFRVSPFDAGSKKDPRKAARRSLATIYTTVSPNFIVLGVNSSDQKLLFHQIERSSVPKMTKQLGAEA